MKIRCKFCNDVIMGDKKGKFIQCKCKSCYIDETEHYCRIGGNFVDIEAVIDFTEYNNLITENRQLKENNLAMQEEMARTWVKHDKLKSTLEEIREYIEDNGYQMSEGVTYDLLQIIDKGINNE